MGVRGSPADVRLRTARIRLAADSYDADSADGRRWLLLFWRFTHFFFIALVQVRNSGRLELVASRRTRVGRYEFSPSRQTGIPDDNMRAVLPPAFN